MSFAYVVDSGVLAAAALKRDARHKGASRLLSLIGTGRLGKCFFTDGALAETLTLVRFSARGGVEVSNAMYELLTSSKNLELVRPSDGELRVAGEVFKKYPELSFVDATTVALMQGRGIRDLLSFDCGFDGIPGVTRHETAGPRP